MRRITGAVLVAVLGASCARSSPGEAPPGSSSPGIGRPLDEGIALARSGQGLDAIDITKTVGAGSSSWVEAVRMHRWAQAAELIDALDAQQRELARCARA
jgi:hypothetical protein